AALSPGERRETAEAKATRSLDHPLRGFGKKHAESSGRRFAPLDELDDEMLVKFGGALLRLLDAHRELNEPLEPISIFEGTSCPAEDGEKLLALEPPEDEGIARLDRGIDIDEGIGDGRLLRDDGERPIALGSERKEEIVSALNGE